LEKWHSSEHVLMKTIETDGITYLKPVPGATAEWYYGMNYEEGDLYEAEEIFKSGTLLKGRKGGLFVC